MLVVWALDAPMAMTTVAVFKLSKSPFRLPNGAEHGSEPARVAQDPSWSRVVSPEGPPSDDYLVQWSEARKIRVVAAGGGVDSLVVLIPRESMIRVDPEHQLLIGTNLVRGLSRVLQSLWPSREHRPMIAEFRIDLLSVLESRVGERLFERQIERAVVRGLPVDVVTNATLIVRDVEVGTLRTLVAGTDAIVAEVSLRLKESSATRVDILTEGVLRAVGPGATAQTAISMAALVVRANQVSDVVEQING